MGIRTNSKKKPAIGMKFLMDTAFSDVLNLKKHSIGHLALWDIMESNHKRKMCKRLDFISMDAFSSSTM